MSIVCRERRLLHDQRVEIGNIAATADVYRTNSRFRGIKSAQHFRCQLFGHGAFARRWHICHLSARHIKLLSDFVGRDIGALNRDRILIPAIYRKHGRYCRFSILGVDLETDFRCSFSYGTKHSSAIYNSNRLIGRTPRSSCLIRSTVFFGLTIIIVILYGNIDRNLICGAFSEIGCHIPAKFAFRYLASLYLYILYTFSLTWVLIGIQRILIAELLGNGIPATAGEPERADTDTAVFRIDYARVMAGHLPGRLIYPVFFLLVPLLYTCHQPAVIPGQILCIRLFPVGSRYAETAFVIRSRMTILNSCLSCPQPGDRFQV